MSDPRSVVLTCAVVVAGLGVARAAVAGRPPAPRTVVGGVVVTVMLAGAAEVAPTLAQSIAVLAATGAVFTAGPPILSAVNKLTR